MTFSLYNPNMKKIDYPVGVTPLDFLVSSIERERYSESIKGIPGDVYYGIDYKNREVTLKFQMEHYNDTFDYRLMRDELYNILGTYNSLYVIDEKLPTRMLKIAIDNSYIPERYGYWYSTLDITTTTITLPFWQSKYTTQDVEKNSFTSIVEQFGLADGLNIDYPNYSFTDNNFTVWNGGNTTIDYRNMYLKIEVQNLTTKGNFTIENLNTGDRFIFNKEVNNQNLVLNGPVITVADDNRLRDTNRAFIKLKPGENKIKISNGTFSEINFDFRYLYK